MFITNPLERQVKTLAPGVTARTFWGEKLMLVTVEFEPNSSVPIHKHPHEQSGMVISGSLEFIIGDNLQVLTPGALYFIPSNIEHGAKCGPDSARVLDIFTPVREELKY